MVQCGCDARVHLAGNALDGRHLAEIASVTASQSNEVAWHQEHRGKCVRSTLNVLWRPGSARDSDLLFFAAIVEEVA
jgi:hypothetical protein